MTASPIEAAPAFHGRAGEAASPGLIGPNAVTRLAEALTARHGYCNCRRIFTAAGLSRHLDHPPSAMIDENDVARLHAELHAQLGLMDAAAIGRDAGQRTGDYLLAHRIPVAAQRFLRLLPRMLAARILTMAISRHAWTFAGSGTFAYRFSPDLLLTLKGGAVARRLRASRPVCDYYAATFERVFSAMLGPEIRVTEINCEACGDDACRFSVTG